MGHEMLHKALTESILGAAMAVLNVLKPGLEEKLYERVLVIELRKRGHKVDFQKAFDVYYDGQQLQESKPGMETHRELMSLFLIRVTRVIRG